MTEHDRLREIAARIESQHASLETFLRKKFVGIWVQIVSNFNNQPYGKSKPSLRGKQYRIIAASLEDGKTSFLLEGMKCFCGFEDIRIMDTEPKL